MGSEEAERDGGLSSQGTFSGTEDSALCRQDVISKGPSIRLSRLMIQGCGKTFGAFPRPLSLRDRGYPSAVNLSIL